MKPLKVCIEARLDNGTPGGIQQVVLGLASGLSKLEGANDEYLFPVHEPGGDWLKPYLSGPCRAIPVPAPVPQQLSSMRRWVRQIGPLRRAVLAARAAVASRWPVPIPPTDDLPNRLGADLVHFPFQAAFPTTLPSIYHPHDLQHRHLPEFFGPRDVKIRDSLYRYFCERATLIAVTSTWVKQDLMASYGLPADKISVIPLAPVIENYPAPSESDVRSYVARTRLPSTFAFYPAQTWPHKNHIGLLRAIKQLRDDGLTIHCVFSGHQNRHFAEVQSVARELGLDDVVTFVGFVSPSELRILYQLARCVVIPTKFEAASFPLWEAFASGVPAACSNVTSLPEQAGDAAITFDPSSTREMANAIRTLWTDESLRARLVERGRVRIGLFNWERTARTFRAQYRRLAGRPLEPADLELLASRPPL